ncbi:hypothetical protein ACFWAP_00805 [Streptomyces goshikiensis]|uniref:hypothetical protein n=1 Tax=Streptomyces goshikiensis TaxID=1942 RepID=UPI00365C2A55
MALKVKALNRIVPYVRDKEDVPHEASLPDLYALQADEEIARLVDCGVMRWWVNLATGETALGPRSKRLSNT